MWSRSAETSPRFAVGLPLMPDRIDHGRFGTGLFQTIYRHNHYGYWSVMLSLEWHMN